MLGRQGSYLLRTAGVLALAAAGACSHRARPATSPIPVVAGDTALPPVRQTASGTAKARADSARVPYTAADIHFMAAMIHHHAQAIEMSRMARSHGASAEVVRLADRIINAQRDEIRTMQQWLADRNQPIPEPTPGPMMMDMGNGMTHEMLMPGMLTEEQMRQLDAARGADFDRLFLTGMIQHHRGAVSMVHDLFETNGAAQDETVFKFASDVGVDQTTEIARMQKMLDLQRAGWIPASPQ